MADSNDNYEGKVQAEVFSLFAEVDRLMGAVDLQLNIRMTGDSTDDLNDGAREEQAAQYRSAYEEPD